LDSLPNCITTVSFSIWADIQVNVHLHPVEAQLHSDLNTYDSFCITIPLAQIVAIFKELLNINSEWDIQTKSNPLALCNLDVWKATYVPMSPKSHISPR